MGKKAKDDKQMLSWQLKKGKKKKCANKFTIYPEENYLSDSKSINKKDAAKLTGHP